MKKEEMGEGALLRIDWRKVGEEKIKNEATL